MPFSSEAVVRKSCGNLLLRPAVPPQINPLGSVVPPQINDSLLSREQTSRVRDSLSFSSGLSLGRRPFVVLENARMGGERPAKPVERR